MIWPVPINVRMNPVLANQLLDVTGQCANEEREIWDFPEYGTRLDAGQLIRLRAIAAEIVRSHDTQSPVAGVAVIGHADRALKLRDDKTKQAAKEQEVSDARAKNAEEQLLEMIKSMQGGPRVAAMIHHSAKGVGATELKIPNAFTEEQFKRNRRVVFKWSRCLLPAPIIHPFPEFEPKPPPKPEDDPNVVFAGNHFRMKILDGFSAGEIGGVFSYHFAIWDVDNSRMAEYTYRGPILTVGVPPFTECGESDWSNVFTLDSFLQADQFAGTGSHVSGSIGLVSGMRYTFITFTAATVKMSDRTVSIFAGPSKSL
ncbi:MAG TPA: hypothetical protein VKE40_21030, partial [Gemmataceae bacterium]|nr:hypothetical protein [Gemmataceae bacterium]